MRIGSVDDPTIGFPSLRVWTWTTRCGSRFTRGEERAAGGCMTGRARALLAGVAAVAVVAAACGEDPQEIVIDDRYLSCVAYVDLHPPTVQLSVGDSAVVRATVYPAPPHCGFGHDPGLRWSLSDSVIAAVRPALDSTAVVTGLAPGSVILSVHMIAFDAVAASELIVEER